MTMMFTSKGKEQCTRNPVIPSAWPYCQIEAVKEFQSKIFYLLPGETTKKENVEKRVDFFCCFDWFLVLSPYE